MLDNGGVERWVVDLCRAGRSENIAMDIAVVSEQRGIFSQRAREHGIPVYHCAGGKNLWRFASNLRKLLREHGPYDAIHCHLHAFSSFAVLAASLEDVPVRVAHSHNVVRNSALSLRRRGYIVLARTLLEMFATSGLAPSAWAAADLFGDAWRADARWRVLPLGLDLVPFRAPIDATSSRAALGIPENALVLGSVGRLSREKNSEFLLEILAAVLRRRADAYLLLIGDGPLRDKLDQKAREGGYRERLVLTGPRSDVPALLRSVMDVFVFPSPPPPVGNEALGLAVVEAQAAGLPAVISDGIPDEAIVVRELTMRLRADAGAEKWAEAAIQQASRRDPTVRALERIEQSEHNCKVNVKTLADLYRGSSVG